MRIIGLALSFVLLFASGCAEQSSGPVFSSGERYTGGDSATRAVADYRLDAGDRIKLTVFNEAGLSGEFMIGADGNVSLPLIGAVPAKGRTIDEVAADTRARLADGYLRTPKVSGEVVLYRPFFILGEVTAPGPYPYSVGLTALNAIATAKGFSPRANREVVQIRRQGEARESNYALTPELTVYPGDTIRVGERYF
jgi:polysaccharide export outer membrane protein